MNEKGKYVSFNREREKPVDAYTHGEMDKLLEKMTAKHNKEMNYMTQSYQKLMMQK